VDVDNTALYVNLNKQIGSLNLDGSIRHDDHSNAGNKITGQLALGYDLSDSSTIYASYGEGFKAPGINDLYAPGTKRLPCNADQSVCPDVLDDDGNPIFDWMGNSNLKPETSKNFEIGLKSQISTNARFEASLFRTKISNLINNSGINFQSVNVDKTQAKGLELGYMRRIGKLDFGLDATSKIGFSVENILNEEYELVSGYNTPGRSAYLSFTYQ